jgi:Holliday junction resolvase
MTGREDGLAWELECLQRLRAAGWMAGFVSPDRTGGQAFDIWAFKDGRGMMVECKHCRSSRLPLTRIEANQYSSMIIARDTGASGIVWAKVETSKGEVFDVKIPWSVVLDDIRLGCKSMDLQSHRDRPILGGL